MVKLNNPITSVSSFLNLKWGLVALFGLMAFSLQAQEICNNAIDDDGDGLIDLNDDECICEGFFDSQNLPSLIPNPSFEDHTCCPSSFTTPSNNFLSCANGWVQATTATSDYQNTLCYTMPASPVPPPDGTGFLGAIFSPGWQEYVGSCLLSPMVAGNEYRLSMQMAATSITGFGNLCGPVNFPPIDITIFGNPSCNQLPFSTTGCPGGNWQVIGSATYTPVPNWDVFDITFTPTFDVAAIIIGSPCTLPNGYGGSCYPYFVFDNLILNETTYYTVLHVQQTGQWCNNNIVLEATSDTTNGTWQWYEGGIALVGETTDQLDVSANNYGAGNYTAAYIIGSQCESIDIEVEMPDLPTSDFSAANVCFPDDVVFTDQSSVASGAISDWSWDFGDNSTSIQQSPAHHYVNDGTYTVELNITTDIGCSATYQADVTVYPKPTADFTVSDGCLGYPNMFTDQSSINSPGNIIQYEWDFGDQQTSSQPSPSNLYTSENTYNVELIVTSSNGCKDTINSTVDVYPNPQLDVAGSDECTLDDVQFLNNSSISNGSIAQHDWDFGDSNISATAAPLHVYTQPATYNVSYTATSDQGCVSDTTFEVIAYPDPVADVTILDVCLGEPTIFVDNSSVIAPGIINDTIVDLGDGNTSSRVPNQHVYASSGVYNIEVIVVTQNGCDDTTNMVTNVFDLPVADFTFTDICEDDSVLYTDASTIPSGNITGWEWDFDNGNTASTQVTDYQSYLADDIYDVELIVSSGNGCADTLVQQIEIYPVPIAAFTFDSVCFPNEIQFTDLSDPNGSYGISTWNWAFSDNQTSVQQSPSIDFGMPGTFSAELEITNGPGCKSTFSAGDAVVHPLPVAEFPDTLATCLEDTIFFADLSSISPITDDAIVNWTWDFDDGNSSTQVEPFHVYATHDLYDVNLTVETNHGCLDDVTHVVEIYPLPDVQFIADPPQGCAPLRVQFIDQTSIPNPYALQSWSWVLGADSLTSPAPSPFLVYDPDLDPMDIAQYDIGLTVTSTNGCITQLVKPDYITVYPKPEADFRVEPEVQTIVKPRFEFTDLSTENVTDWNWSFGDGTYDWEQNPVHYYPAVGNYPIGLIVETEYGCRDTIGRQVKVEPIFTFYVPNSFTPDADGINDDFFGTGEGFDTYNMKVYDRWGELIFESNNPEYHWDGTYKGQQVQQGTYAYQFYLIDWQGDDHFYKGHVTLHR